MALPHGLAKLSLHDAIQEVPVLIVGGSVVGLSLAALLAHHGVQNLVVEKHSSTAIHPRATVMMRKSIPTWVGRLEYC